MRTDEPVLLGLDIGGTSSRAMTTDRTGRILGIGEAAGGNPNSHPPQQAVREIAGAARAALAEVAPGVVSRGVLGMAGVSKLSDPSVAALFERTWHELGLTCPMRLVSDCEVAFASGSPSASGTVLIAGTGSIAARIHQHRQVATSGGYGWLLGDEGSSFWLGREAVRHALHVLDQGCPLDALAEAVPHALGIDPEEPAATARKRMITAANAAPPIQLAEFAPLVTTAADAGEKAALDIIARAAGLLADTAQATRTPGDSSPIVLAGSLVATDNPLGVALRAELSARAEGTPHTAGAGAAGAAWLAALDLLGEVPPELHARLLGAT